MTEAFKDLIELCWFQDPKQRPDATSFFKKISQIINDYQNVGKLESKNEP